MRNAFSKNWEKIDESPVQNPESFESQSPQFFRPIFTDDSKLSFL
jgi:hypothetical protein